MLMITKVSRLADFFWAIYIRNVGSTNGFQVSNVGEEILYNPLPIISSNLILILLLLLLLLRGKHLGNGVRHFGRTVNQCIKDVGLTQGRNRKVVLVITL
ncbi:hypothetical protein Hanom_Chr06g00484461 [Helianthus anomalus]